LTGGLAYSYLFDHDDVVVLRSGFWCLEATCCAVGGRAAGGWVGVVAGTRYRTGTRYVIGFGDSNESNRHGTECRFSHDKLLLSFARSLRKDACKTTATKMNQSPEVEPSHV
jgi:hypothetical protein